MCKYFVWLVNNSRFENNSYQYSSFDTYKGLRNQILNFYKFMNTFDKIKVFKC